MNQFLSDLIISFTHEIPLRKRNPTFSPPHIGNFPLVFITSPNTRQKQWALIVNKSQHFHVCSSAVAVNLQTDLYPQAHTHTEVVVKLMGVG